MSIDIMNRLWWREDLGTMEKFVALALADASSDDGLCWPSVGTIARKCSCNPRTVKRVTATLEAKGFIRKKSRVDRSSYYIFNIDNLPHVERPKPRKETSPVDDSVRGDSHSPDLFATGDSLSTTGDSLSGTGDSLSMTGDTESPRTIIEPSEETSSLDSGDFASPATVGIGPSLKAFVEAEWHKLKDEHPGIADVRKIDDGLERMIEQRAKAHAKEGQTAISVWSEVFTMVRRPIFLTGRAPPGRDRDTPFKLSLGWIVRPSNFREVINGKYSSDRPAKTFDADTGRRLGPTEQAARGTIERLRNARKGSG